MQVEASFFQRRRFAFHILSSGILLAALAGCHRAPSPDVVAMVNGKEIMRSEMEKFYQASMGDNPQKPSPEQADIVRLNILRQLIEDEIVQQRAAKLNLAASDEDVNAKLTEMKAPYTQEEFEKQLKARNITLDDLKREIRRNLTSTKLLNKEIESKINITDAEISSYYQAHKSEFNMIEPQYHLAWIVVTDAPSQQAGNLQSNKASSTADAKKKIQTLQNRLDSGEDFSAVAMSFSEDPNTSSIGGDMGFVAESALQSEPEVYTAVSKLKPGEITGILPTYSGTGPARKPIGFAIYKLMGREPAGQRELNDPRVQQHIHQLLHDNRKQLLQNAYIEVLHDQATVRNYYAEQILKNGAQ
ncbi:MAG: SurA N-terminal domain-containing protein [Terracidiphilus sp.]